MRLFKDNNKRVLLAGREILIVIISKQTMIEFERIQFSTLSVYLLVITYSLFSFVCRLLCDI